MGKHKVTEAVTKKIIMHRQHSRLIQNLLARKTESTGKLQRLRGEQSHEVAIQKIVLSPYALLRIQFLVKEKKKPIQKIRV